MIAKHWRTYHNPITPGCKLLILKRRDVRVVEGARLESVCRGNSTVGSGIGLSSRERRACLPHISQGRELSPGRANPATLNYSVNHARSGPDSCSASLLHGSSDLAAPTPPLCLCYHFHDVSRAAGPAAPSCENCPDCLSLDLHVALFRADFMRVFRWDAQKQPDAPASTSASQADCRATSCRSTQVGMGKKQRIIRLDPAGF